MIAWTSVVFERIGRTGTTRPGALAFDLPEMVVEDEGLLFPFLYRHCGKNLASREFNITVDMESGEVLIDGGRFGRGQLHRS